MFLSALTQVNWFSVFEKSSGSFLCQSSGLSASSSPAKTEGAQPHPALGRPLPPIICLKFKYYHKPKKGLNFPTTPLLASLREEGRRLNVSQSVLPFQEKILDSRPVTGGRTEAWSWKTEFQSWFWLS